MALTKAERERVADSVLKIQSVTKSLRKVNPADIPDFEQLEACLEDADQNLRLALRAMDPTPVPPQSKQDISSREAQRKLHFCLLIGGMEIGLATN